MNQPIPKERVITIYPVTEKELDILRGFGNYFLRRAIVKQILKECRAAQQAAQPGTEGGKCSHGS